MMIKSRVKNWGSEWAQQFKEDLQVQKSSHEVIEGRIWSNQDLDPTPPEKRNWTWMNYGLYFIGCGFNSWTGGSSVIGVGLGWKTAIAIMFVTQAISGLCCVLIGKPAARYHIGFPAMSRTVYGMYGSYYQVIVRAILAAVWYATQMYAGASYLEICFKAIFGHHFTDIPNQSKGKLALEDSLDSKKMSTSQTAWMVIYAMTSTISNGAAYIESFSDMARWSKTPHGYMLPTFAVQTVFNPLSAVFGILGTSALQVKTGQIIWKPWDIMSYILEQDFSSGTRFGIFLLALLWIGTTVCQNFSSNLIPFGSDVSMLWPRHITMTRGFIVVHLLAWCICPWKIYASATTFLDFMGAYGIFMGPAVSIMICEYFLVCRGNIFIPSIYIGNSSNPNYWYTRGWNIQAYVAYIVSVGLCFVGFVNRVGADVPDAGVKLGYLGWFLTFPTGFIVYYFVTLVWPHQNAKNVKGLRFEQNAIEADALDGVGMGSEEDGSGGGFNTKDQIVVKSGIQVEE
ncbi:hypothetical protein MPDQ_003090 [Monascus purpureus]|uniref:Allantoin permease n=1 Tax=Monascus purpureus TaxID=5098 RepID=A0A507R3F4_MONPU|nr:hypothetical protein MPDQ_003090 [Monascus purpureus]